MTGDRGASRSSVLLKFTVLVNDKSVKMNIIDLEVVFNCVAN